MEVVAYADVIKDKAEKFLNDFGGEYAIEDADRISAKVLDYQEFLDRWGTEQPVKG